MGCPNRLDTWPGSIGPSNRGTVPCKEGNGCRGDIRPTALGHSERTREFHRLEGRLSLVKERAHPVDWRVHPSFGGRWGRCTCANIVHARYMWIAYPGYPIQSERRNPMGWIREQCRQRSANHVGEIGTCMTSPFHFHLNPSINGDKEHEQGNTSFNARAVVIRSG